MRTRSLAAGLVSAALLAGLAVPATAQQNANRCTRAATCQPPLVTRTYPIAELVVPINMDLASGEPCDERQTLEADVMKLIRGTVAPNSWDDAGGRGSMQYFPLGMALVVTQTAANHAEVRDLLTALRHLQDVEVAVEVRLLKASECVLDRFGIAPQRDGKPVVLDDDLVSELLEFVQADLTGRVVQAPKLTVFNGQRVRLHTVDEEQCLDGVEVVREQGQAVLRPRYRSCHSELDLKVRPTVAADRGSVRLEMDLGVADDQQADGRSATLRNQSWPSRTVADGKTAVLHMQSAERDGRLLVLVTPRVIVNESEEQEVIENGTLPPCPRR